MSRAAFVTALVVLASQVVVAQPLATVIAPPPDDVPAPPPPPPPDREPTAADVAAAPVPGDESGRTDPLDDGDTTGRAIGRMALFVPKLLIDVAFAPVHGSVWLYDRYHLDELYYRVFFNDARTIGLYPTAAFESGFGITGLTGGARFVARDLFGEHEHLALQAAAATSYYFRQLYSANFRTGDRLGKRFSLEADLGYEIRPRDAFYGIGNGDASMAPAMPVDPRVSDLAVETRFSQHRARGLVTGDARLWSDLHLRPAAALVDRSFGNPSDGIASDQVYTMGLVGWGGVQGAYGELELRWDDRQSVSYWDPHGTLTGGTLASAFAGQFHRLEAGADFTRYGFDLQQFVRIGIGPRVIVARVHGEAVTGSRADVPFTELPSLGGPLYLRGYPLDRFRDRVAAFGTLEYQWDLAGWIMANAFVDAGRVYSAVNDISVEHLRVGYGLGLQLTYGGGFVSEVSVASSVDGGLFLNLAFNPVYDIDQRVRRR